VISIVVLIHGSFINVSFFLDMMVKKIVQAIFAKSRVLTEHSEEAKELWEQSRFGEEPKNGRVELSLIEAMYLLQKERIEILDGRNTPYTFERLLKLCIRTEPKFWIRYRVFSDLRDRGYIVKTALKFGADFRVYDRGVKPGEDHAKWVVFPVSEGATLTWHEWASKNRVAHSTKKRLLMAVADDESDVSYWEARWVRP
jgi:tRNA-intron endonuclease, archaea type